MNRRNAIVLPLTRLFGIYIGRFLSSLGGCLWVSSLETSEGATGRKVPGRFDLARLAGDVLRCLSENCPGYFGRLIPDSGVGFSLTSLVVAYFKPLSRALVQR